MRSQCEVSDDEFLGWTFVSSGTLMRDTRGLPRLSFSRSKTFDSWGCRPARRSKPVPTATARSLS